MVLYYYKKERSYGQKQHGHSQKQDTEWKQPDMKMESVVSVVPFM